jgi:Kdo2-lipid IVA lauroyltransferase/acyltransferase
MKIIKYFFEALFVYLSFIVAKLIGLKFSRLLFSFIFKTVGPIIKSKNIIENNLFKFSSNLTNEEKNKIKSNMWSNYGMTFIEYVFLKKFRKDNLHIEIEGEEILNEIANRKKPVIFVSGHFANFEFMSMEITRKKINLATIYRPLNNFFLNSYMEYLRKKYVCRNQIKKGRIGVKEIIEYINNNNSIALMIDQRVTEGEKINFFNHKAFTTTLPGHLSLKYNLDIVPIFIERIENSFFKMKVYKPIRSNESKSKFYISLKLNQILEGMIMKNPNQWIWTHNRWK